MMRITKQLQLAVLALTLSVPALAEQGGRVPVPQIPQAVQGEKCVEPVEVMRRKHMDFIMHQRDETMRKGIRTTKYSLKQCLECHVPADGETQASAEGHFCKNCHMYTGVRIDCFECHNTKPEKNASASDRVNATTAKPLSSELLDAVAKTDNNATGAM